MDGAEIIVEFMKRAGISTGFGVGGGYVDPLLYRVKKADLAFYVASRESGAAFAADGYARVHKKPAFVITTAGPGETNAITAVANASADSIPMMILTGHVPTRSMGKNAFQDSSLLSHNITEIFARIAKSSYFVYCIESLFDLLRLSLVNMMTGRRGPVHLTIPYDVLVKKTEVSDRDFDLSFIQDRGWTYDSEYTGMLSELLRSSVGSILVIAGNGVLQAGAIGEFQRLVEGYDIRYVTTPKAKSLACLDERKHLGTIGLGGTANPLVFDGFGTVVILGSSLSELSYLGSMDSLKEVRMIFQVDIDHHEITKIIHHVYGIVGDLKCVLASLCSGLETPPDSQRREQTPSVIQDRTPTESANGLMHPGHFLARLSSLFPPSAVYFSDSGSSIPFSVHHLKLSRPNSFHIPLNFAPMGWAVGAAIGAAVAVGAPNASKDHDSKGPFVCITGEHAFLMEGFEAIQAVRHGLPVVFVILNNGIYNMPYHRQHELYGEELYSSFPGFELGPSMQALGVTTFRIDALGQLDGAFVERIVTGRGPWLIEAFVDPAVKIPANGASNIGKVKDIKAEQDIKGEQDELQIF